MEVFTMMPEIIDSKFVRGDKVKLRCAVLTCQYTNGAIVKILKNSEGEVVEAFVDPDFRSLSEAVAAESVDPQDLFCYEVRFGHAPVIRISAGFLKKMKTKLAEVEKEPKKKKNKKDAVGAAVYNPGLNEQGHPLLDANAEQPSGISHLNGTHVFSDKDQSGKTKSGKAKASKKAKKALKEAEKLAAKH